MKVTFDCPGCDQVATAPLNAPADWQCPRCDHRLHLNAAERELVTCVCCGNHEFYKKKDFPHWLGMTILIAACSLSTLTYLWYEKWWTWGFLIGSAIIDGAMYLMVRDVIVCYRCQAHYRGFLAGDGHPPFDLGVGERYRQETLQRERLKKN